MGNSQQSMPKVEFEGDSKLRPAYLYSKHIEAKNFERSLIAKKTLRKKRILGSISFLTVISIYCYTIYKIRQETFLDDFDEPPRIIKTEN